MSSLIDFDTNLSSQDDDNMQMLEALEMGKELQLQTDEKDARKEMLLEVNFCPRAPLLCP